MFEQFGISYLKFLMQASLWLLVCVVPALWASKRILRNRTGAVVPIWILLVWIFPIAGPLSALVGIREAKRGEAE